MSEKEWDNGDLLRNREVVLANGGRMMLSQAVEYFDRLRTIKAADNTEWDAVDQLREVAFDRPIEIGPRKMLIREGHLNENGELDPAFRDVILSAVRGENEVLHIESPFTDSLDRALADYATSREFILSATTMGGELDATLVRKFLSPSRFEKAEERLQDQLKADRELVDRLLDGTEKLDPVSEEDLNKFTKRLMDEAKKRNLLPDDKNKDDDLPPTRTP